MADGAIATDTVIAGGNAVEAVIAVGHRAAAKRFGAHIAERIINVRPRAPGAGGAVMPLP